MERSFLKKNVEEEQYNLHRIAVCAVGYNTPTASHIIEGGMISASQPLVGFESRG